MKWAHRITISAFAKPEEDLEKIKKGIIALVPFDLQEEKVKLEEKHAKGFTERIITIFTIKLTKTSHTNEFLKFLLKTLTQKQKEILVSQAESRLDEHCDFFIRIDKDAWMDKQEMWMTDSGNCYHIKLTLAVFPKKQKNAIILIEKLFSQKNI